MQEIKLKFNQPFNLEGKMVKIVEVEQPQKERWFKKLTEDSFGFKKGRIYRGSTPFPETPNYPNYTIEIDSTKIGVSWQEVQPDFICQHSGEAFMYGTECFYTLADRKDTIEPAPIAINEQRIFNIIPNVAFFYTREDALAWQEKKFGKKEESLYVFHRKTFEVIKCDENKVYCITSHSVKYASESECKAARDRYILENEKVTCEESFEILGQFGNGIYVSYKNAFINYILNKKGGNK